MLYFGNQSSGAVRESMSAGLVGCIVTPAEGRAPVPGAAWGADNGKFGKGYPGDDRFLRWIDGYSGIPACWFVVAPDAPFDAQGTLKLSPRFFQADQGIRQ